MTIDTESTIYVCKDRVNGEVKLLVPRGTKLDIVELDIADPDPESTDAAEYKLAASEMDEHTIEILW